MSATTARFAIFKPSDEIMNLALPILLLALVAFEMLFQWPHFGRTLTERLLVDVILLNVTHNAFTFMMLFSLPELKPWLSHHGAGNPNRFWIKTVASLVGLSLVMFCFFYFLQDKYTTLAFVLIGIVFPMHHALSQSFGLSLLYNRRFPDKAQFAKIEKREKVLSKSFLVAMVATSCILILASRGNLRWTDPSVKGCWIGAQVITLVFVMLLVINMLSYPGNGRLKKLVFSVRYFLWALTWTSPIAIAATKIIHGIEYAFVTRKVIENSKTVSWVRTGLFCVAFIVTLAVFREMFHSDQATAPTWLKAMAAVSTAISYFHYYLDRKLFQFRFEINRNTSGRLLF